MKVVVIGAGFGGLGAAVRLRALGHDVTVLEKRDKPGGRAYVFEQDGFVFDAGPTIITAPQFIDELFVLAGRRREEYVTLVPLDPFYRVRFEDGTVFACASDEREIERQVEAISPGDVAGWRRFANDCRRIFDEAMPLIDVPFDSLGRMLFAAPALVRTRAWRSVAALAARHFRDPRLRQLFSFHPLLIGGHPFRAPAIYALIPELEKRWGVWYAMGGTGALTAALARLIDDTGGKIRYDADVVEISIDDTQGRATGVRLRDGEWIAADIVVSNADAIHTYSALIARRHRRVNTDRRLARFRFGMSAFVLYLGLDRRYETLGHHEILMGPRYRGLLDDVFRHGRLAPDFSLYVHHPTATDPTLAPPGCDLLYALAPVPHLGGTVDWEHDGDALRDRIVAYLESRYLPDLSRHIVTELRVDPRYFHRELNAPFGSAFSIEPLLSQSAWFRPRNKSEDVPNLYHVGASTHPGAGIPGVLSSAKITAQLIADRYGAVDRAGRRIVEAAGTRN
jgi:phytoene desaturase